MSTLLAGFPIRLCGGVVYIVMDKKTLDQFSDEDLTKELEKRTAEKRGNK